MKRSKPPVVMVTAKTSRGREGRQRDPSVTHSVFERYTLGLLGV